MKRITLLLLLSLMNLNLSCQPAVQSNKANGNTDGKSANKNSQVTIDLNDEDPKECQPNPGSANEILVTVTIDPTCKISTIDPDSVYIRKGQQVRFCVINNCPDTMQKVVSVTIGNFRVLKDPVNTNPFGSSGNSSDNTFNTGLITTGKAIHKTTPEAYKSSASGTYYKYDVFLWDSAGNRLDNKDPQVVISDSKTPDAKVNANKSGR